uniref:G-protein coupled receptors family 1 profile domain-containing protein n=1 Tax=Globodera rostochiensis TaxID=31243 RepID=A0A914HD08_GLORO
MEYNATSDLWYQYFNADGPQWLILLGVYGFRALWATLGICFDFGIVYITVKSKSLRSICNILIAMESAFALILNNGYYVSFLVVLSGIKFIRYEYCFWYLIVPSLFGDLCQMTMVLTGADRLCAVAMPIWYQQRKIKQYLAIVAVFLCCFAIYDFVILYSDYIFTKNIMISCAPNDIGLGPFGPIMNFKTFTLSAVIVALYTLCWFFVFKFTATSQNVTENNRKLIKSLLFIIGLNLIGVAAKSVIKFIFQYFMVVNVFLKTSNSIAFSFLTITVYSANTPVLYIVSTEYRARFNQHLPMLTILFQQKIGANTSATANIVAPTATVSRPWVNHYNANVDVR